MKPLLFIHIQKLYFRLHFALALIFICFEVKINFPHIVFKKLNLNIFLLSLIMHFFNHSLKFLMLLYLNLLFLIILQFLVLIVNFLKINIIFWLIFYSSLNVGYFGFITKLEEDYFNLIYLNGKKSLL